MRMSAVEIRERLRKLADGSKAEVLQRFFKTGPGQYGEGDVFLGITVPVLRKIAKEYSAVTISEAVKLLPSSVHEERLLALFLLIQSYTSGDNDVKDFIYSAYLQNLRYVNNWDLVDVSAPKLVGHYLSEKPRQPLYRLARSSGLWDRRIAIVSTLHFIRQDDFEDTFRIAEMLVRDEHDLIHKAVGWMLREVGKRDRPAEEKFLKRYYRLMPRTMLRYAIERFPEKSRVRFLKGKQ